MATNRTDRSFKNLSLPTSLSATPESTKKHRAKLPCKMDVFFQFCRTAWGYCGEYLDQFTARSARYTPAYLQQQLSLVDTVEALPTLASRRGAASLARTKLMADAQAVKMLAQDLKTYIITVFPQNPLRSIALKDAALSGYSSMGEKWGSIANMVNEANQYMATNLAVLMENNNMPPSFPTTFAQAGATFNASWADFIVKEKAILDGTGTQEEGISQVLAAMNPMLEMGKRIFIFDPLARKKFTAAKIKAEVQGKQPAGVKGAVKSAGTNKPLANVSVSAIVDGTVKSDLTNAAGKYKLKLPAGGYTITFALTDSEPLSIPKKVRPGVMGRLSVELQPLPVSTTTPPTVKPIIQQPSTDTLLKQALEDMATTNGMAEVDG